MVKQVLLCGCGNIGFRHLQAMSTMETPAHIIIVEPFQEAHERISDFISSQEESGKHSYSLASEIPSSPRTLDLVVIATNADTRQAAFEDIIARHSVSVVIFEKILFQSVQALDAVQATLEAHGIRGFVNCGRRGFDSYHALFDELDENLPTHVTVTGSAFGLASNAVHFLDLIEFLNRSSVGRVDLSGLHPNAVESKRAGFYEIFGTLEGMLKNGAALSVTCEDDDTMNIVISIQNGDKNYQINELKGTIVRDDQVGPFEIKYVSGMPQIYDQALEYGDPGLTPYIDSANQHRLYLRAMCKYLGLPTADETLCPIS